MVNARSTDCRSTGCLAIDLAQDAATAADGPRGPNAARALCEERHDMTDTIVTDATIGGASDQACCQARYQAGAPHSSPADPAPSLRAGMPRKLATASLGRSHRSKLGKQRLAYCIELMRELLKLPDTHRLGIVPGSDTGAFEMAMWTMLGCSSPVTTLAWESFGEGWVTDAVKQLKIEPTVIRADYGRPARSGAGRLVERCAVYVERHHQRRARPRRRLDRQRPRGAELRRCDFAACSPTICHGIRIDVATF